MDHADLSNNSILEMLLKTNRPPTDQERAIIQESMSPTNAELKAVEDQISEATTHIRALTSQSRIEQMRKQAHEEAFEEAEGKLKRLRKEKAAILEATADHRRALSTFRNLPEDVLREICVACVEADIPKLSYRSTPLPYILAQISSDIRRIALTTPFLWASIHVCIPTWYSFDRKRDTQICSILASRASEWLDRAGGSALTVFMEDPNYEQTEDTTESDPSHELFTTLLRYSTRWRRIHFESNCRDALSTPITRIAALTAIDAPLLESISLSFQLGASVFYGSTLLEIPTLKRLTLNTFWDDLPEYAFVSGFNVNWAVLTSLTLRGGYNTPSCVDGIAWILLDTKCLIFCDIVVNPSSGDSPVCEINLPFLEILHLTEKTFEPESSRVPSILDLLTAPNLTVLKIRAAFLKNSLLNFFKRSPRVQDLSICHSDSEESFAEIAELLHHCPLLSILSLQPPWKANPAYRPAANVDSFLRAFVEDAGAGVLCPRLQKLDFPAKIVFSLQTLRQFLEAKQRGSATQNDALAPWKSVRIDMICIKDLKIYRQMLDLLWEKREMGLDVESYYKDEAILPDKYLYRWEYS
ncbi:hypothetical protein HYPSUDRAFT_49357 [Hypholoma sublateritium FD-334 SS-4]|uniref:F-box domain-containing protein n=1 Tax=Hypholoma sublateritium (strain FD-334 SS-4) TaxID=945553 RepID=A0A0D2NCF5_HYPSF|nr:hypothetical protein HYPSUDRAFT_49357 [Hypholoma sublateritium FD-334 SS-4]